MVAVLYGARLLPWEMIFAKIEWKDTSKNPQEVKTTPSQNDLDLVKGLRKSGRQPFTRQSCRDPQESPTHSRRERPPDASPLRASPPGTRRYSFFFFFFCLEGAYAHYHPEVLDILFWAVLLEWQ